MAFDDSLAVATFCFVEVNRTVDTKKKKTHLVIFFIELSVDLVFFNCKQLLFNAYNVGYSSNNKSGTNVSSFEIHFNTKMIRLH